MTLLPQNTAQEMLCPAASVNTVSSLALGQPAIKCQIQSPHQQAGRARGVGGSGLDRGSSAGHGFLSLVPSQTFPSFISEISPRLGQAAAGGFRAQGRGNETQQAADDRSWALPKSLCAACRRNQKQAEPVGSLGSSVLRGAAWNLSGSSVARKKRGEGSWQWAVHIQGSCSLCWGQEQRLPTHPAPCRWSECPKSVALTWHPGFTFRFSLCV